MGPTEDRSGTDSLKGSFFLYGFSIYLGVYAIRWCHGGLTCGCERSKHASDTIPPLKPYSTRSRDTGDASPIDSDTASPTSPHHGSRGSSRALKRSPSASRSRMDVRYGNNRNTRRNWMAFCSKENGCFLRIRQKKRKKKEKRVFCNRTYRHRDQCRAPGGSRRRALIIFRSLL